jgi:hypothetical protein
MSSQKKKSELILEELSKEYETPLTFFSIFKNPKGTRFTYTGFTLAKSKWTVYTIKLPVKYKILTKTLLLLDERMSWPYYLDKTKLVLFDEMDAFEFSLYQGDINLWSNKF